MGAAPTVSIVIPARNEAEYLSDCLDSVAALEKVPVARSRLGDVRSALGL